jgi:cytochrome c oxidase cbb3-type subunit 3
MKRIASVLAMMSVSLASIAQGNEFAAKGFWDDPFNHPMTPLYAATVFVFAVVVLVAIVTRQMIKALNILAEQAEKEKAARLGVVYVQKPSWWARFSQTMNASVAVEQEQTIELDHNYDGIKELDNHLPPWWKYLFYATIGWSVVYLVVFHISSTLPLSTDEYENEVALAQEQIRKLRASQPRVEIDENTLAFSSDSTEIISKGKSVFNDNNCGSCHRNDGGGNAIGPNLTDQYWLHGGHIRNVFGTIRNGVVEKGMPAWGKSLSPQQVRDVAFYVMSLQGTNPAKAKAPQGEMYKLQVTRSDSTVQASL